MVNGVITKGGDPLSRYSYTIISDDHGATWRIGSGKIQPRHTTECVLHRPFIVRWGGSRLCVLDRHYAGAA